MGRLQGKVCIVTGAGSRTEGIGVGKATSVVFAREGAKVLLADRDPKAVDDTRRMIEEEGGVCDVFVGDLTDATDVEAMVAQAVDRWGTVDVLDNNLGISGKGSIVDASDEVWDRAIAVNITTTVVASRTVIPIMGRAGGGSIINTSSISAMRPRGLTPYSTVKGAVMSLTRAMAVDHGVQGIRVNCVVPGPLFTPMAAAAGMDDERRERRRKASPLQIEGTGWDVAYASLFFASDEARYITGVIMPVDGGVTLTGPSR